MTRQKSTLHKSLSRFAKEGDKILDTHLGSGSSRIAAYKMGFDFWGFEIDQNYFLDSQKRFENSINEPLFQDNFSYIQTQLQL